MSQQRKTSIVQELLTSAQSESEKLQLSEEGLLIGSLHNAVKKLSKDFSYNDPFSPTGSDPADYSKMFEKIGNDFAQLGKELLKMRSSYLPFTMINDALQDINAPTPGSSKKISEIIDADTTLESYENTFFRLLGMPSTADIRDKNLITVSKSGAKRRPEEDNGFFLTNKVLEKRALAISDRLDHPSSTAYDFIAPGPSFVRLDQMGFAKIEELGEILIKIKELTSEKLIQGTESLKLANSLISLMNANCGVDKKDAKYQKQEVDQLRVVFGVKPPENPTATFLLNRMLEIALVWLEPTLEGSYTKNLRSHIWAEHISGAEKATMDHLHDPSNFWRYSHLLFPPVQDERILTCINEPSKMVAEPFLPESMRTVNGHKIKSTLLEAVIRIRLDIVTGFPQSGARVNKSGMAISTDGDERSIRPDELGLLEALLIVRLFSALHGFAEDVKKKIEAAIKAQYRSKKSPSAEPAAAGGDNTPAPTEQKIKSEDQLNLESIMLVEESLLLLFGDGGRDDALAYQEGVARNSGVKSAHLMSAALSVLDVPKRWAEQELGKINEIESRASEKEGAKATSGLRQQLGVAKGVGAIDLLAYLIALFTAEEDMLLALLNDRQYENLKKEYPAGFFDHFLDRNKTETGVAVNHIASRAFDAYALFGFMVRKKKFVRWGQLDVKAKREIGKPMGIPVGSNTANV